MKDFGLSAHIEKYRASTVERVSAAVAVLGIAVGGLAVTYFNPVTAGYFPQCPLYALTGLSCPGCGLTRGFHAFFHGDILGAFHFNALLPVYAFIFGYLFLSLILITLRGRGLPFKIFPPFALWMFLAVSIIFAVVRNLPFYPFNLLAL